MITKVHSNKQMEDNLIAMISMICVALHKTNPL